MVGSLSILNRSTYDQSVIKQLLKYLQKPHKSPMISKKGPSNSQNQQEGSQGKRLLAKID